MILPSRLLRLTADGRWRCAGAALRVVVGALFLQATTHAAEPTETTPSFRFELAESAAGCPTEPQMRALIIARLGFDPFAPDATTRIRVELTRRETQFEARIQRFEADTLRGERVLHDPADCDELAAASALAASILIDPAGALAKRHSERTSERNRPPPDLEPTPAEDPFSSEPEPAAPPPPPEADPFRAFVNSAVIGSVGTAPGPALGFSLGVGARWRRLVLRLEGRGDLPVHSEPLDDGSRAKSSLLLGTLLPCFAQDPFELCGVLSTGAFIATSDNISPSESNQTLIAASGLRAIFAPHLVGPVHLTAHAEAVLLLKQVTLTVRHEEVWSSPPLAFSAGLGIMVHFL